MAVVYSLENGNKLTDWTDEINLVDGQPGLIANLGIFEMRPTSQTSITFDKNVTTTTLIPRAGWNPAAPSKMTEPSNKTYSLALENFSVVDAITSSDLMGVRMPGSPLSQETFARLRLEKLTNMRYSIDQTKEYMQLQAAKGIMKSPDGTVIADMFDEFGVTQEVFDFALSDSTTDVAGLCGDLKRYLQTNLKNGNAMVGEPLVIVDSEFFKALVSHDNVKQAFLYYQNQGRQYLRDGTSNFLSWGSVDQFSFCGITFMTYDATFNLPGGTTEAAIDENSGIVIPRARGLYRGYNGPSSRLSLSGQMGRDVYAYEFPDKYDLRHEFQAEFSNLYFGTNPAVMVKVTAS